MIWSIPYALVGERWTGENREHRKMSMTAGRRFLGKIQQGICFRARCETVFRSRFDTAANSIDSVL